MTTIWNAPPNSVALEKCFVGTEVQAGTPVTPTFKVYGRMMLNKVRQISDREEYAGTRFADYEPVFGPWEISGTLEQPLSYEDWAILPRYSVAGGGTGVTDGESIPGYTYARVPHAVNIADAMTIEGGTPNMPWTASAAIFPEFTVSADIDDSEAVWKWSSPIMAISKDFDAGDSGAATGGTTTTVIDSGQTWTVNEWAGAWVRMVDGTAGNIGQFREVLSNTATTLTVSGAFPATVASGDDYVLGGVFTAGITDRTRELISGPGTQLFIDPSGGTIGTTEITNRFISFSHTYQTGISTFKRFMEHEDSFAAKPDLGKIRVMGQIRLEFDRLDEYEDFAAGIGSKLRIQRIGSVIDSGGAPATTKLAIIDVFDAVWTEMTEDERNSNKTVTWGYRGYVDASEGVPVEYTAKNTLSALP
jgi:hypothetical protein